MTNRFSRLSRFEEKKAYRRLLFSIAGTILILLSIVFLGIPALIKFSLFIGNLKSSTQTETKKDSAPPFSPHLEAPYTATNSAEITVSGYAPGGTNLEIFLNGESFKKMLLGNDGQFVINNIPLQDGENKITANTKDSAGNISSPSDPLTIIFKKTLPRLDVSQPQEGESFTADQKEAKIMGLTENGANVSVNGRLVMVNNDGSFTYSLALSSGENLIKIVATDIAGNQKTVERKVNFSP